MIASTVDLTVPKRFPNASPMLEEAWRNQVVDLATWSGWRVYYVQTAVRQIAPRRFARTVNAAGVGFPDLFMVRARDCRIVLAELKRDHGAKSGGAHPLSTEQQVWLDDLGTVGKRVALLCNVLLNSGLAAASFVQPAPQLDVYVWRPADIEQVKRALL